MVYRNFDCAITKGSVQIVQIFAHLHFDLPTSHTIFNVFDVHIYLASCTIGSIHYMYACSIR